MAPVREIAEQRVERFGGELSMPSAYSVLMEHAEKDAENSNVVLRQYGPVSQTGELNQLLGPVSEDSGNTVIVWATVPNKVGRFSFNIAVGDQHETFLMHFNPRFEPNGRFTRIMFGTKRDLIWDASGNSVLSQRRTNTCSLAAPSNGGAPSAHLALQSLSTGTSSTNMRTGCLRRGDPGAAASRSGRYGQ